MNNTKQLIERFSYSKLLSSDSQTKTIVLLGSIEGQDAIITIEKSHFAIDEELFAIKDLVKDIKEINHNDIYYWSHADLIEELDRNPSAKLNLIYPATETHIRKYSQQQVHYVMETPEMYRDLVIPYIETMKGDRIRWVYNILFEGKESESVIYHNKDEVEGFVLLPDMKWDKININTLYLTAIVMRKDISSVRDLNGSHVKWLSQIQSKIKQVTTENYNIAGDELRIFIHYHPSYYHFHIHVVNIKHPGLGDGISVGRAILLDDVIENLKLLQDYYSKKTIGYLLGENHGLWPILKSSNDKNLQNLVE